MSSRDRNAVSAAPTPVGPADDDPLPVGLDPGLDPVGGPAWVAGSRAGHCRPAGGSRDTTLDAARIARVRDAARRTRPRVERRLAMAGLLPAAAGSRPGDDGQRDLDWRRDLDGRLDEDMAFLEHIDTLHERRLRSPSARERQAATRTLAEALYRIVDGYWVDDGPPHRPVQAARRLDDAVGHAYGRLSTLSARRRPAAQALVQAWARYGRWVRLALALVASVLLATGSLAAGAAVVVLRTLLSFAFIAPAPVESPRQRLLGYNSQWASCVATHVGDAAVLAGLGRALTEGGRPLSGAVTAVAALVGLTATMTRVAASSQGFRLGRLHVDRAMKALALPAAAVVAALAGDLAGASGVVVAGLAVGAVALAASSDVGRVVYWAVRRRRLFRRVASAGGGPVPDVIVARTSDALVMNITRTEPRAPLFDEGTRSRGHLRVVADTTDASHSVTRRNARARGRRGARGAEAPAGAPRRRSIRLRRSSD